ncbi:MAG TPA: shikimate dehydrogenase [Bacteroidales bacterium]|nr:shikimate dehydrogenase [Bacteroidales bacterium]
MKREYGLIGHPLSHSFSQSYFSQKFKQENIQDVEYHLFDIKNIELLPSIIHNYPFLQGLNVTYPYKNSVLPFLDIIDETAQEIGAVNTILVQREEQGIKLHGFNSDVIGFKKSYENCGELHRQALIFGTGGAGRAVAYVLKKKNIAYRFVSRNKNYNHLTYNELTQAIVANSTLLINATPLGMGDLQNQKPNIPYEAISSQHLLFDLIYNPQETLFLKEGKKRGATIKNGLEMLHYQADESWEIWKKFLHK